jgi:O-antigen/teichoic acid export membrane protein
MDKAEKFRRLTCTQSVRADLRGTSVRAAAFTGVASAGDFLIRIGSTAVLARLIVPEHFGLVMMVTAVTAIAEQLRELGLSAATVQQKEITHEQVTNLFWINTLAGAVIAAVVCALSPLIASYYHEPRLTAITCVLATNFLFGGLMVQHQALLTRQMRLGHTSVVRFGSSLVSTVIAIVLAWMDFGYWALVWREVARSVLLAVGMWIYFPWIPGLPSRRTNVRSMVGFGTNLTLANIFGSLAAGADRFLLGRLAGAAPVAVYRQAYQLMVAPTDQLVAPLYNVAQPGLSMLQGDAPRFRRYYQKVLMAVCVITMPLSLFVAVYSTEIARALLGPNWNDCGPVLMILSFGTFIRQAVGSSAFVLITRGKSGMYLRLTLLNNFVFIALATIGARWGIIGVAIADVATLWVMLTPRLYYSLKESPVTVGTFFATAARPAAAALLMAAGLVAIRSFTPQFSTALALVLGCVAALLAFPLAWLVMPGGKAEFVNLLSDLKSLVRRRSSDDSPGKQKTSAAGLAKNASVS